MDTFYLYKMTSDSGGAPCVENGMLSLAICKPVIRRTARVGDIIIGFGGKKFGEKLIYVAKISKVVVDGDYYRDNTIYSNRQDCIYSWHGDELVFKEGSKRFLTPPASRRRSMPASLPRRRADGECYSGCNVSSPEIGLSPIRNRRVMWVTER
jgi:Nucleotide modification associated domain 2